MNKKLFLGMFAAAGMLLATSCSNDELDMVQSGNEAQVTFSLGLEGGIATRAISDGESANKLVCAVYDANLNLLNQININGKAVDGNGQFVDTEAFDSGLSDNIKVTLAKGQTYTIAFWAQNKDCGAYETSNLKNVTVSYEGYNNDENRDAFFAAETFKVSGNAEINVTLKRPFAQINVGVNTEDWTAATASGVTIEKSSVIIKNVATSMNVLDGTVTGADEVSYMLAAIPNETLKVDTDGDGNKEDFHWLSMSYILAADANTGYEKTTLEALEFTFDPTNGENIVLKKGLTNVPVQRNWRTNILGKLLTGDIQFNIVIDPAYIDDYNYPEYETDIVSVSTADELVSALQSGKKVLMVNDIVVPENTTITIASGVESTLDLNSLTLSSTNTRTETHNDFILVKGTLNVKNGTITYNHTGSNMGWNGCTNLFDITGGGFLNVNDVVVNNLGGTDMNFAVHMNNWGAVTLNADKSEFLATYCGVRVFNSGYDLNNVTIKNSKLTGGTRAFWVHNYIGDLNSAQHTDQAIKSRLNFSIFNNNTFEITGEAKSPIRYGFANPIYYDLDGGVIVTIPENNTEDVVLSTGSINVTVPADDASAGDDYKVVVSNESTDTDNTTGETTVAFDLTMYKNDVKVSGTTVYAITKNIGTGLFISEVTHNGIALTEATTGADQTYTYDSAIGVLTIYTASFRPFAVTYANYKDYVKKLNAGHSLSSYISTSTGSDLLPIVAVNPEITGYSVFNGETRITNTVTFRFSDVKKETINENSYKVSVNLAIKDDKGNDLELKEGMPSTINGKEYLHVYMNLIEVPAGYAISEVKVGGATLTAITSGNVATGEYWIGYEAKDLYFQSKTAGLIEVTLTK